MPSPVRFNSGKDTRYPFYKKMDVENLALHRVSISVPSSLDRSVALPTDLSRFPILRNVTLKKSPQNNSWQQSVVRATEVIQLSNDDDNGLLSTF